MLDVAIDASHLSNEDLLDIYSKLQKISPQQREAFLEEQFSDLVSIDELIAGRHFRTRSLGFSKARRK